MSIIAYSRHQVTRITGIFWRCDHVTNWLRGLKLGIFFSRWSGVLVGRIILRGHIKSDPLVRSWGHKKSYFDQGNKRHPKKHKTIMLFIQKVIFSGIIAYCRHCVARVTGMFWRCDHVTIGLQSLKLNDFSDSLCHFIWLDHSAICNKGPTWHHKDILSFLKMWRHVILFI